MRKIKFRAWDKIRKFMITIFDSTTADEWFIPNVKEDKVTLFKSSEALQELVDRATPKKPIQKAAGRTVCPNCERSIAREVSPRYCIVCGQRLDWSENNE